jgi:hypothetical protein
MSEQQSLERIESGSPVSILEVIERASRNPDVDVEKMRALLDMHTSVLERDAESAFNAAMAKAQGEVKSIAANALNPQTRSKYATYDALNKTLRPIYIKNGFALSFGTIDGAPAEYVRVVADVSHSAGHSKRYQIDMPADGKGAKGGDVMTKTHAVGAGVSYGMRYLLKMIFNVAIGEDDNDGNEVAPTIDKDQILTLEALIEEVDADRSRFLKYWKVNELADIPVSKYKEVVKSLEGKRK